MDAPEMHRVESAEGIYKKNVSDDWVTRFLAAHPEIGAVLPGGGT